MESMDTRGVIFEFPHSVLLGPFCFCLAILPIFKDGINNRTQPNMTRSLHFPTSFHFPNPTHSSHLNSIRATTKTLAPRIDNPHFRPLQMTTATTEPPITSGENSLQNEDRCASQPLMSKRAQKKLLKQQKFEAKKAQKKALAKEQRKREGERKRREWEERVAGLSEEEREKLIGSRKGLKKERMEKRCEERESKVKRLNEAKTQGQNIVVDLEFASLMTPSEINSLVQQIMYCYAMNARCSSPGHLWLTGCHGEMEIQLQRLPGFDKWIIEKENRPYVEAFQDRKEHLVYLTADSENILEELDPRKIYIVGGLVDRNRWKGITMKKAEEQGIQTAKLPIGNYLKMSGSKVLTVNQVIEILLKFLETRDWKTSFFKVIPQRKRCEADSEKKQGDSDGEDNSETADHLKRKKNCVESCPHREKKLDEC
ncbi:tRNA (guanine(9)-N1)-methyltransferase-like [Rhododendron vialii]|uniref:tRNA (guanine(9)-N1)-methyltransferase-like n=1 Tax=Rhododendron vialii TaxID=182163 RepID=UPI00265D778A|nr:tRNA (guanine(9)-N1)-methyltransferase-like [Rhododendron vialii]